MSKPHTTTLLRLIDAQLAKLKAGLPQIADHAPMIFRLTLERVHGQIDALEEVREIVAGERKGFSE